LKSAIADAIDEFAPDAVRLDVEGVVLPQPTDFVPVSSLEFALPVLS
jgi:hypothetical protein